MLKRIVGVALVTGALLCPSPALAGTYQVQIRNKSPYCVSLVGVAVPGTDPSKGVFLHLPGTDDLPELRPGGSLVASYGLPRPAKMVEVQGGPPPPSRLKLCPPNSRFPRRNAHADKPGGAHDVFTIIQGPNETIVVK